MSSEPGDYIGAGRNYFYAASDGTFTVETNTTSNWASIRFANPTYTDQWQVQLMATHYERLSVGIYREARRPYTDLAQPGLDVSGQHRGCGATGSFQVKEVIYGPAGELEALWAVFEQHCEGQRPALRGDLRLNAQVVVALTAPLEQIAEKKQPIAFDLSAADVEDRIVTLTATGLPDGATFIDHGDNTGTFSWTPAFSAFGPYDVSFHADNGTGQTDSSVTRVMVEGTTSLFVDSEPGDVIGEGKLRFFSSTDGRFTPTENFVGGASTRFLSTSFDQSWSLDFEAPFAAPLVVGTYSGAIRFPAQGSAAPAMAVSASGRSCSTVAGSFEVKQIQYGPVDEVSAFWATFEQRCNCAAASLKGEIRVNADVPVLLQAPRTRAAVETQEATFDVIALESAGGPVSLAASNLPAGATFTDHGDNSGKFRWTPVVGQAGTYDVKLSGQNSRGDKDTLVVKITVRLANDDFDDAIVITSLPFEDSRDTRPATRASDDPSCPDYAATVWYSFTPATTTDLFLSTVGSSYDTNVSVYSGSRGALQPIACQTKLIRFSATAGQTYHFMVGHYPGFGGTLAFSVTMAPPLPPPPRNDDFSRATRTGAMQFSESLDTSGATVANDDPASCGGRTRTVWYAVRLMNDARVTVRTTGSDYATSVSAFSGVRGGLDRIVCGPSQIGFNALQGKTYYVMVDAVYGDAGANLNVTVSPAKIKPKVVP